MQSLANGVEWLGDTPPPKSLLALLESRGALLADTLAFPGLINSHDHLEFNCYPPIGKPPYVDFLGWASDVQAERGQIDAVESVPKPVRVQFGILKNLLWGVTAVADHGGKTPASGHPIAVLTPYQDLHSPELESPLKWLRGLRPAVVHLAEGTSSESRLRAQRFLRWNLLKRRVAGIHGTSLQREDFPALAAFIWCPGSNLFLFGRTADAAAALHCTQVLFGTDSTLSTPGTLWDHLRQVRGIVSDEVLFAAMTTAASAFWRCSVTEDFVLARRSAAAPSDAFYALRPKDLLLVVCAGRVVLLDETLARALPSAGLAPVRWGGCCKLVGLPIDAMMQAAGKVIDPQAIIDRFGG